MTPRKYRELREIRRRLELYRQGLIGSKGNYVKAEMRPGLSAREREHFERCKRKMDDLRES